MTSTAATAIAALLGLGLCAQVPVQPQPHATAGAPPRARALQPGTGPARARSLTPECGPAGAAKGRETRPEATGLNLASEPRSAPPEPSSAYRPGEDWHHPKAAAAPGDTLTQALRLEPGGPPKANVARSTATAVKGTRTSDWKR